MPGAQRHDENIQRHGQCACANACSEGGFWWRWNLLASRCVEENIKKARRAFFSYGSIGAFQGVQLNPLSATSVIESCIMPILLYGAENWIMTPEILSKLFRVNFQREFSAGQDITPIRQQLWQLACSQCRVGFCALSCHSCSTFWTVNVGVSAGRSCSSVWWGV